MTLTIFFIPKVSELSFQDGSVYNSEMENIDQESPTEPLDVKLVQPVPRNSDSPASLPPPGNVQIQVVLCFIYAFIASDS